MLAGSVICGKDRATASIFHCCTWVMLESSACNVASASADGSAKWTWGSPVWGPAMFLIDEKCSYGCYVRQLKFLFHVEKEYVHMKDDVGSAGGFRLTMAWLD